MFNTTKPYVDILHLEDDDLYIELARMNFEFKGLTYKPVKTLHDWNNALRTMEVGYFMTDANGVEGGKGCDGSTKMLAQKAVDSIGENYGAVDKNRIIVFSSYGGLHEIGMEESGVNYVEKPHMNKIFEIVDIDG